MKFCLALASLLISNTFAAEEFITLDANQDLTGIKVCEDPDIISCQRIKANVDVITENISILDLATLAKIKEKTNGQKTYYHFENDSGTQFKFTVNRESENARVTGDLSIFPTDSSGQKRLFLIRSCGDNCQVLIEEPESAANGVSGGDTLTLPKELVESRRQASPVQPAVANRNEKTTITIMFWKTQAFEDLGGADDIIDNMVETANEHLANSNIPLEYQKYCSAVKDGFDETNNITETLLRFKDLPGNFHSADIAVLVTTRAFGSTCGLTWVGPLGEGYNVAVVANGCGGAGGMLSHELGHILGCNHNRDYTGTQVTAGSFAYGKWLDNVQMTGISGAQYAHTVMAYNYGGAAPAGRLPLDCFSSPDLTCKGVKTGDANNNNRQQIINTMNTVAGFGDESKLCTALSRPCVFSFIYERTEYTGCTMIDGQNQCSTRNNRKGEAMNQYLKVCV